MQRLRGWIILLLGIIVWIMIGSVLYATTNGWNFAQSLYFAVDVGFLFGSGAAPSRGIPPCSSRRL